MCNKKVRRIIYAIVGMHFFSFFSLHAIPATAIVENKEFIVCLNSLFLILSLALAGVTYLILLEYQGNGYLLGSRRLIGSRQLKFNVLFSSVGSLSGFLLIFYDRVFIRGIDYSLGLRLARYQWLASPGGSIFGITGNLLIPLAYFSLFLFTSYQHRISKRYKFLLILSVIFGILGHAVLNGGRSNILIALFVWIAIYMFVKKPSHYSQKINLTYFFFAITSAFFLVYMTNSSATMAGISMKNLSKLGVESLFGKVDDDYNGYDSNIIYFIYYVVAYLFHGNWTAEISYSLVNTPGNYTFFPLVNILNMLGAGLEVEPNAFAESGAFISLPGAFFYDYGFLGVLFFSSILGVGLGSSLYSISYRRMDPVNIAFCLYFVVLFLMAPILPAYGLMCFNFVIYIFVTMGIVNMLLFGTRIDWSQMRRCSEFSDSIRKKK